ncbi:hypothetical protein [Heyndrickxia coagulans]|uniref:Uncharacterized protein n=1 Tax=Heyndrickxia coagulans TaxID=1398 RepID=A0AAW7CNC1_HEYCO|nr:hypothetical protein [Heyndrickxia coagulans]MDL5042016.1 hypothetical protein [Heyndrickxia coagulans]
MIKVKSNFSFFKGKWDVLANLGETAEKNVYQDPHTTIMKLELKQSILSKAFRGELGTNDPTEESAIELLKEVLQEQVI